MNTLNMVLLGSVVLAFAVGAVGAGMDAGFSVPVQVTDLNFNTTYNANLVAYQQAMPPAQFCFDDDTGFKPGVKGYFGVYLGPGQYVTGTDACMNSTVLFEGSCTQFVNVNGKAYSGYGLGFTYDCASEGKVCSNGKCV